MAEKENGFHAVTREGPVPLSSDSWDLNSDDDVGNDPYRGVRRASSARRRLPLVVGLVVLFLAATSATLFAPFGVAGAPHFVSAPGDAKTASANPSHGGVSLAASSLPSNGGVVRTGIAVASASTTAAADDAAKNGTSAPVVPPFTTLVFEAEAGLPDVKLRSAQVVAQSGASGGKVVAFTAGAAGDIQFRHIVVPSAGTFRFAIYYAAGPGLRTGNLVVGTGAPLAIAFAPGTDCCAVTTVETTLPPGTYTATLTLAAGDDNAPTIDRIVISKP